MSSKGGRQRGADGRGGDGHARLADTVPAWLWPTAEALGALLQLPDNWNGLDAEPVSPRAATTALEALVTTMPADAPAPAVQPTARGGVQLTWHTRGIDLTVMIARAGRITATYADQTTEQVWAADLTGDLAPLFAALADLAARG